jgi:hypothetical protein
VRIEFYELVDQHRRDNGLRELAEYDFNENITMALGLYFELGEYGTFTTGAVRASGY